MQESLRAAMRHVTLGGIICSLLFAGTALAASASDDLQPQPSPSPNVQPQTGSNAGLPKPVPATVGHYPIVDIIPIFSQPASYANSSQIKGYDPLDVGGTVRVPITSTVSVSFDRLVDGFFNVPTLPYITAAGKTVYTATTRDEKLVYRADAQFNRFTLEGGFSFRQRDDAGGGNGVTNAPYPYTYSSTEHHYGYVGVTYATSPISWLLGSVFSVNVNGYAQPVDHHVGELCSAALFASGVCSAPTGVWYLNEDPHQNMYYEMSEGGTLLIPLHPNVIVQFTEIIGALNFYENADGPYRYNGYDIEAITKKFTPFFSLTMRHQGLHQSQQGYPFPSPQTINTGVYDIFATFHVDFNKLLAH
ncbi:MAG: hypothetical protein ABR975_16720 [Vulcanimicrobiaceae bacterium]|jgi:hypothetical protein